MNDPRVSIADTRRALSGAGPGPFDEMTVADAMTREVVTVRPDMTLRTLRTLLLDYGVTGLPVVDDHGVPLGVVSKTDLVRVMDTPDGSVTLDSRIDEVMTHVPLTVSQATPLSRAVALMAYEGVHRVLVVSSDRRVVGVFSAMDILHLMSRFDGYLVPPAHHAAPPSEDLPVTQR